MPPCLSPDSEPSSSELAWDQFCGTVINLTSPSVWPAIPSPPPTTNYHWHLKVSPSKEGHPPRAPLTPLAVSSLTSLSRPLSRKLSAQLSPLLTSLTSPRHRLPIPPRRPSGPHPGQWRPHGAQPHWQHPVLPGFWDPNSSLLGPDGRGRLCLDVHL